MPLPIKRIEPRYPVEAAGKGQFGYVTLRLLVDETGQVTAVDTLDSFPKQVFEKSAITALKQWRYQADGQKHIRKINLSFALEGGVNLRKVDKTIADYKLWDGAAAGIPQHQLVLDTLLEMVAIQSGNRPEFDASQPLSVQLDLSLFQPTPAPKAAKNGDPDAQRIMAAYHDDWEQYLLSQQHAEVMAWAGTRLLLEGQREQGLHLLDQAIAKNYPLATELKKQFL